LGLSKVAAKEKLDVKKTRLIELLDAKLTAVEKKNVRLMEMMEQVLRDKETHTHRLVDATKNMEDLSKKLAESEKARSDMRNINRELKTMLDNIEGKGTQIAKLAKEKVLKYKGENERIQRELDDLRNTDANDVLGAPVDAVPTNDDAILMKMTGTTAEQLCRQLDAAIGGKNWQEESVENLRVVLAEVGPLFVVLCQMLKKPQSGEVSTASAANRDAEQDTSTLVDREKRYKEEIEAKDREIATLKDELNRLKSAIGQLVGLNLGAVVAPT
jgi:chromosome segregation ATPase